MEDRAQGRKVIKETTRHLTLLYNVKDTSALPSGYYKLVLPPLNTKGDYQCLEYNNCGVQRIILYFKDDTPVEISVIDHTTPHCPFQ